jgi:hypothetical protein
MEKSVKQGSTGHQVDGNGREIESGVQRRAWHRPVITRIDIKRTILSGGSVNDGTGPTI